MANDTVAMVIRGVISLVVIAGWIVTLSVKPESAEQFTPMIVTLIAFWFGDSLLQRVQQIRADQHSAEVTKARIMQGANHE